MSEQGKTGSKELVLRVLKGLHAGAELVLWPGEYIIGRGEECDVILEDENVASKHCQLKVTVEGFVEISPLEGLVYVNGHQIEGSTPLDFFQVVTIGNVSLAVGPAHEKWPELKIPSVLEKEEREEKEELPLTAEGQKGQPKNLKSVFLGIFVVLLVTFILIFLVFAKRSNRELKPPVTVKDEFKLVQEFLKKSNYPYVQVLRKQRGRVKVVGYVETNEKKQILYEKLKALVPELEFRVYSNEELLNAAQEVLAGLGFKELRLQLTNGGQLTISGFISDKKSLAKLLTLLKEDVPGFSEVKTEVVVLSEVQRQIKTLLAEAGVSRVQVAVTPSAIVISGTVGVEKRKQVEAALRKVENRYGSDFRIVRNMQFVQDEIKIDLKAIYVGSVSYIVLTDNKKYFEGSILPGGYLLKKIEPRKLILVKQGKPYYYFIGR